MTVNVPWPLGQIVYLRVAHDRVKGMVTGYLVRHNGASVLVTWPDCAETTHYPFELTTEYVADYE